MSARYFIVVDREHPDDCVLGCAARDFSRIIRYSTSAAVSCLDISGASCLPLSHREARFLSSVEEGARLDWVHNYPMLRHLVSMQPEDTIYILRESACGRFLGLNGNKVTYYRDGIVNSLVVNADRVDFDRMHLKDTDVAHDSSLVGWGFSFRSSSDFNQFQVTRDTCASGRRVLKIRSRRPKSSHDVKMDRILGLCRFDLKETDISVCVDRDQTLEQFLESNGNKPSR